MEKYVVLDKTVGQTPLECAEAWREAQPPAYAHVPLTYAGRLDPMASGKLLVLIDEECKQKERYLALDKEYHFSLLFGISSDTGDVLGLPTISSRRDLELDMQTLSTLCEQFTGEIELPYPHYSSKTVAGKPLHTWTLEGRLNEIVIPTKQSVIYKLKPTTLKTFSMRNVYDYVSAKIETIAPVSDIRKSLGNDFRRPLIRPAWLELATKNHDRLFYVADFTCIASSGTYMRTLAQEIAKASDTTGLAYSIHRSTIGRYQPLPLVNGFWKRGF